MRTKTVVFSKARAATCRSFDIVDGPTDDVCGFGWETFAAVERAAIEHALINGSCVIQDNRGDLVAFVTRIDA